MSLARAYVLLGKGHAETRSWITCLGAGEQAITVLRNFEIMLPALYASALVIRGWALQELERFSEARTAYGEALAYYLEMGDERRCIGMEINLAEIEFGVHQVPAALLRARNAASRAQAAGDVHAEANVRANAAAYYVVLREIDEAKREARAALRLALSTQRVVASSLAIQHLATIAALEGDAERAARLSGYVDARYAELGFGRSRTEQSGHSILLAELRARLSDERIAQLAEAGSRLSDNDAAAEALGGAKAYGERRV